MTEFFIPIQNYTLVKFNAFVERVQNDPLFGLCGPSAFIPMNGNTVIFFVTVIDPTTIDKGAFVIVTNIASRIFNGTQNDNLYTIPRNTYNSTGIPSKINDI